VTKEYLRRNLVHASSIGVVAEVDDLIGRANIVGYLPKWLLDGLEEIRWRANLAPKELAAWRDVAPDTPQYIIIDEVSEIDPKLWEMPLKVESTP
jgi:hypothetical protein